MIDYNEQLQKLYEEEREIAQQLSVKRGDILYTRKQVDRNKHIGKCYRWRERMDSGIPHDCYYRVTDIALPVFVGRDCFIGIMVMLIDGKWIIDERDYMDSVIMDGEEVTRKEFDNFFNLAVTQMMGK